MRSAIAHPQSERFLTTLVVSPSNRLSPVPDPRWDEAWEELPTVFYYEIRHSFPSGEGKPANAFNIFARLGRLFSVFRWAQRTIVSENSQAPSSVYNTVGMTGASKF